MIVGISVLSVRGASAAEQRDFRAKYSRDKVPLVKPNDRLVQFD